jgi:hypothetical protein
MRVDLLDAYSAIDWANSQLPILKQRIADWINRPAYTIVREPNVALGQNLFKLRIDARRGDALINAEVGAIINSLRSSLDLLASALAQRNGMSPSHERHFPIVRSINDFIDPLAEKERKKWLSERERTVIEALKPYEGGNNLLIALHHLDIVRKHERLVRLQPHPGVIRVSKATLAQGFGMPPMWPGFNDGAVVAWTNIDAADCDLQIGLEVTFNEPNLPHGEPIIESLSKFVRLTENIVQRFEST